MNLYELTEQAKALSELIDSHAEANDGDISEIAESINQWACEYDIEKKLESIAMLVRNWEAQAEAQRKESERLYKSATANENKAKKLKEWACYCLANAGISKANAGVFSFSVRTASQAPLILLEKPSAMPKQFQKVIIEPNKEAIKDALKNNDEEAAKIAAFGQKTKYIIIGV